MKQSLTAVALGAALALPAGAQGAPDLIPRDVVMAILRHGSLRGEPAILVGDRLPDSLVNKVSLPPGAHVLATLEAWSTTEVIGTAPQPPDSVRGWFASEFTRRKYEAQDAPGHRAPFRPAEGSAGGGFCGAGTYFNVSADARTSGQTEFVLRTQQRTSCDQSVAFGPGGSWSSSGDNPPPLPMLFNPKNAEALDRCDVRGGGASSTAETGLSASASPEQLLAHYGKQLDSAGWRRETVSTGAVGTWTRRDSTGRDVRVQITALPSPSGGDCRWVTMTTSGVRP